MNSSMSMTSTSTDKALLVLIVGADRGDHPAGTWPTLHVVLKNASKTPVELCTYMLRHRLLWSICAKGPDADLILCSFEPKKFDPTASAAFRTLGPGAELTESLPLGQLEREGWHFVPAAKQAPVIGPEDRIAGPKAGTYTFAVSLTPWAVVYGGESGKHDRRISMARIPEDLGLEDRDLTRVYRNEIVGCTSVRFV
jgi:hypothetical protein